MGDRDDESEEALERSSLGSAGAGSLRKQTPREQVDQVRRLARLRNHVVSANGDAETTIELILLYTRLGYEADLVPVWCLLAGRPYLNDVLARLPRDTAVRLLEVTDP